MFLFFKVSILDMVCANHLVYHQYFIDNGGKTTPLSLEVLSDFGETTFSLSTTTATYLFSSISLVAALLVATASLRIDSLTIPSSLLTTETEKVSLPAGTSS